MFIEMYPSATLHLMEKEWEEDHDTAGTSNSAPRESPYRTSFYYQHNTLTESLSIQAINVRDTVRELDETEEFDSGNQDVVATKSCA